MESFWHDLRFGLRLAIARPGFTAVAVLALALGIGPNTAVFSVINTLLLIPPPYADPDTIITTPAMQQARPGAARMAMLSTDDVQDWRQQSRTVQQIALYRPDTLTLTGRGDATRLTGARVSPALFPLLGVQPARGRAFTAAEENPAAAPVVILSHVAWERLFGGDPAVLGQPIQLDGVGRQVVGIMPPSFDFPNRDTEYWAPLTLAPPERSGDTRRVAIMPLVARLKPGATSAQAEAEANAIIARNRDPRQPAAARTTLPLRFVPLQERTSGPVRPALLVLAAVVGFVLLIACANVAALLLSRTAARRRELAIRAAIGAGRGRLVRQMLTEGAVLAILGGVVGVVLAYWMLSGLVRVAPPNLLASGRPSLDASVLVFAAAVSLLTSAAFGLAPALSLAADDVVRSLKEGGREAAGFRLRGRHWMRGALTVAQAALALILLVGAGLFARSLVELLHQNPGYQPSGALVVEMSLPRSRYPQPPARIAFYDQLLAGVRQAPGVAAVGLASTLPMARAQIMLGFDLPGIPEEPDGARRNAGGRLVSAGFLRAMGSALIAGRDFTDQDRETSEPVVIVNSVFAERYLAGFEAIGRQIDIGGPRRIVGVAESMKPQGFDSEAQPEILLPYTQFAPLLMMDGIAASVSLVARTDRGPLMLVPAIRAQVGALDQQLAIFGITTLDERLADSVAQPRFFAALIAIFAILALGLAVVGIYGMLASQVAQSTREIGIQMALGAGPGRIRRLVLGHGMGLIAIGLGIGLVGAWGLSRLVASLLFAVRPLDPMTYAAASLALLAAALAGAYVPARRATAVDPVTALRCD